MHVSQGADSTRLDTPLDFRKCTAWRAKRMNDGVMGLFKPMGVLN